MNLSKIYNKLKIKNKFLIEIFFNKLHITSDITNIILYYYLISYHNCALCFLKILSSFNMLREIKIILFKNKDQKLIKSYCLDNNKHKISLYHLIINKNIIDFPLIVFIKQNNINGIKFLKLINKIKNNNMYASKNEKIIISSNKISSEILNIEQKILNIINLCSDLNLNDLCLYSTLKKINTNININYIRILEIYNIIGSKLNLNKFLFMNILNNDFLIRLFKTSANINYYKFNVLYTNFILYIIVYLFLLDNYKLTKQTINFYLNNFNISRINIKHDILKIIRNIYYYTLFDNKNFKYNKIFKKIILLIIKTKKYNCIDKKDIIDN